MFSSTHYSYAYLEHYYVLEIVTLSFHFWSIQSRRFESSRDGSVEIGTAAQGTRTLYVVTGLTLFVYGETRRPRHLVSLGAASLIPRPLHQRSFPPHLQSRTPRLPRPPNYPTRQIRLILH